MGNVAVVTLKAVLALCLLGSVFVQTVMVALLASDLNESPMRGRDVPILLIVVLGVVCTQVVGVCVWRLLTMVRRGTVFSNGSFRYVNLVGGAIAVASVLVFALAVVLAPGEEVPPGVVGLICGLALLIAGIALVVLVLRMLLEQAVARDLQASHLQAELDEVI